MGKIVEWFGKAPIWVQKVQETNGLSRLIVVFSNYDFEYHTIDMVFWKNDSVKEYRKLIRHQRWNLIKKKISLFIHSPFHN